MYFLNEIDKGEDIRHDMLWKGQRNILNGKEEETIMSKKGTVRGVKNRVRAGIATFLQDQTRKVCQQFLILIKLQVTRHTIRVPVNEILISELHRVRARRVCAVCDISRNIATDQGALRSGQENT